MNLYETIRTRRSVRSYHDRPIPQEVMRRILEAARIAPSAGNRQPWKLVVVTEREMRKKIAEAANNQTFVGEAAVVIAAVGLTPDRVMSCGIPSAPVDIAIAIDHITLAATAEGLGSCWIGAFSQEKMCNLLNIPKAYKVIQLLALGYPSEPPRAKTRKSLEEILCYETFS